MFSRLCAASLRLSGPACAISAFAIGTCGLASAEDFTEAVPLEKYKERIFKTPYAEQLLKEANPGPALDKYVKQREKEGLPPLTPDQLERAKVMFSHPVFQPRKPEEDEARRAIRARALEYGKKQLAETESTPKLPTPIEPGLSDKEFRPFEVSEVEDVSHNTRRLRFKLHRDYQTLGLTVASCLVTKAELGGKTVTRPYTPTSSERTLGHFDLVVKSYPEGVMSKHIYGLKPGDTLEMKGPFKKIEYTANMKKAIGMIAGGTGITPMYQVITKILSDPRDKTEVRLLFANETQDDILLKDELDALAVMYPNFKVYYTLSKPPAGWSGYSGFVNKAMIADVLPPPSDDHIVFVCGPPGMMEAISGPKTKDMQQGELTGALKSMGYSSPQVYKF